jgi:biotin synthase
MRKTWEFQEVSAIYNQAFNDLLYQAHTVHRANHDPNQMHLAQLLNIKTGACPEDCGYCSQSGHHNTELQKESLCDLETVISEAAAAKASGAKRFCLGAAYRSPPAKDLPKIATMISEIKKMGLETCATLGMLNTEQAQILKDAGLDYYNHNLDTSRSYYDKVVTTRSYDDRLDTLDNVRNAGMAVCCGGILGLGETMEDRIEFLITLANLPTPPESVPINRLIAVKGTPMQEREPIDNFELVRTIATARIIMPSSVVRLTAGRVGISDELQAMCFYAGANSIFISEKLLTKSNPETQADRVLLNKLGISHSLAV